MKLSALAMGALALTVTSPAIAGERLNGAGASFPAPLYQRWFKDYAAKTGNEVNYQAVGSGAGVRQYKAGTTDFGASDKAVSDKKLAGISRPMVQIPMTGGAIAVAYNKPGCDLKLSQVELTKVFYGRISDWSELGCAAGPITVAVRSDGSGTTAGFTNSLSAFSPYWAAKVGRGKSVAWPAAGTVAGKGNSGVAGIITNPPGSIGYVNYGYVKGDLQQVAIQNKAGNYVTASAETASAGLGEIVLDDQLRGADANPAGANAYPIVSLTWILAYPEYEKNDDVKDMLRWMLTPTQQQKADSLGYVPLPESLRQKALAAVDSLR
jgi:phosphate transport system substrate-binding protein